MTDIVHVPSDDQCPTCGSRPVAERTVDEPALVRHGGHGATRHTVTRICPMCGWHCTVEQSETRPAPRTVSRWDCLHRVSRIWAKGCTACGQPIGTPHADRCPKVQGR